ncbi:MAG: gliding motility-associated ABC transporter substrate-binding protein GldG [Bacteroidota bacterium]|nr:gliding motility-associated ABC transporter substrate-binding protein GldG [Bacteroidota bacterium]
MKNRNKKRDLIALGLAIIIVILLNFVGSFVFHRFDLTSEKRYTLSDATKKLLKELDDVVYVKVYLDGEFPAGFKRLRNETKEMLDEFRAYSNDNIEYEFIDPTENPDKKQQNELYKQLYDKGLQPTPLEVKEENGTTQQIIVPGALVTYHGSQVPWNLLKTQLGRSAEAQLNNSIQALEYEFASCIRNLTVKFRPKVAFIEGHGELDTLGTGDIRDALSEFYTVKTVVIDEKLDALNGYKAIVIAKPDTSFSEKDKFIIDQFLMKGGRILWAIDPLDTNMDSLVRKSYTIAIPYEHRLDDMLFKYGVRLNQNMIADIQCSAIPVNKAMRGEQPRFELMPWVYSPLMMPENTHAITKNLDLIKIEYGSSIDTVSASGISKTILLKSSKYTKTFNSPARIFLEIVNRKPDEKQFRDSYRPVAVLLEGEFESVYKNRVPPEIASNKDIGFKDHGQHSQMIVISDGDVIRNDVQRSSGKEYPLGYDKYTNQTYGNKNFILNCMNYLCDDSGLISVRARELTLRLLDKKKVKNEKLKWQMINTVLPLLVVGLFGLIYHFRRKNKYSK